MTRNITIPPPALANTKPLLSLSLFLKRHRQEYYRRLNAVRVSGDWEGWIDFFLDGVATIADEAVSTARDLFALVVVETTGKKRNRRYAYQSYLHRLRGGTELGE